MAVAGLLTKQHTGTVTLNRHHEEGAFEESEDGFGCGCDITLHTAEEEYSFYRGDCTWSIVKDSGAAISTAAPQSTTPTEPLSGSIKTAHPQQLADSILRIIANDQQELTDFANGLRGVPTGGS
ncbi:hypothetical protein ACFW84_15495 [Streptomyces anulatus]|uniref:hypothetical protein n=1 Tax=Streptomyces anulatus TaxID=1892 RepID=UPI0036AB40AC